jgi:uncharacterized protein YndB with AHSA1/START domain
MAKSTFMYVTYIAAAPETIWRALLEAEFTRQYWGHDNVSDWKPGSTWKHQVADGTRAVRVVGEVIENAPPRRLVLTWADPADAADRSKHSRVTFEIEPTGDVTRLTVTHDELEAGSEMLTAVTAGWPRVLSSLKSMLETGRPLPAWAKAS